MLGKKRDRYDLFTGSTYERDLVEFLKKSPLDQWKQLMVGAEPHGEQFKECVIYLGMRSGFCDKTGSLITAST